jgi:hypothetical protein
MTHLERPLSPLQETLLPFRWRQKERHLQHILFSKFFNLRRSHWADNAAEISQGMAQFKLGEVRADADYDRVNCILFVVTIGMYTPWLPPPKAKSEFHISLLGACQR